MHQIIFLLALVAPHHQCQDRVPHSGYIGEAPMWNWGQRLAAKAHIMEAKKVPKKLISQRPFLPFSEVGASAGPLPRNDGTVKTRNTHDTLKPGYVTNGLEEGFTTLDVLQKEANKHGYVFQSKIKGSLGGLDPREVFYADDDLIIIKGGGFENALFEEGQDEMNSVEDNKPTKWSVKNPPSLDEEYNGNIATIVAPPNTHPYWRGGRQPSASTMPSPFSLFLPANVLTAQESNSIYRVAKPFHYPMMPILHPMYIRPRPLQPFMLYVTMPYPNYGYFENLMPTENEIITSYKKTRKPTALQPQYKKPQQLLQSPVPTTKNYLIKEKKPPTYLGDTNVNYLDPKPRFNPDAEMIPKPRAPK